MFFLLLQNDTVRNIKQFHFTGWPETGVPKSGEGIIDLIGQVQRVYEQQEEDGPITVHCRYEHEEGEQGEERGGERRGKERREQKRRGGVSMDIYYRRSLLICIIIFSLSL